MIDDAFSGLHNELFCSPCLVEQLQDYDNSLSQGVSRRFSISTSLPVYRDLRILAMRLFSSNLRMD